MGMKIECRSVELYMNDFLEGTLIGDELWDFLNHVLNCNSCYEELETRFLLREALLRLEEGETLDLRRELRDKIKSARMALKLHRLGDIIYRTIEIVAGIVIAFYVGEFISFLM